jgi:uncharacterized protein (DUF2147 family)
MKPRLLSMFVIATSLFASTTSVRAQSLAGTWLTQDGSSRVQFRSCAQKQCGYIVWLREPVDPETGKARQDKFNSNDSLKSRPLVGLLMITDIAATTAGAWEATLYNPRDGNSYRGKLADLGGGRLQLKGCALLGLICKTEVWTRAE